MTAATRRPLIMAAPNGARRTRADHPRLPLTTAELAETAAAVQAAGADAIHVHVRDAEHRHSLDPGLYREALAAIGEAAPGLPVQVTTEAAGIFGPEEQFACLEALRPAWASVALREIARTPTLLGRTYALAREAGIRLQTILYDRGDIRAFGAARRAGLIAPEQNEVLLVLGSYGGREATPEDLPPLLSLLRHEEPQARFMVCAFGRRELACLVAAMEAGGDVRTGFENNLHRPDGLRAMDNAELVALAAAERSRLLSAAGSGAAMDKPEGLM